jgi:quercetin dioxygenase-like cupin family protein
MMGGAMMLENRYDFIVAEEGLDERIIEKIVDDNNVVINHMLLIKNSGMPEHYSNSHVYMIIVSGEMTIKLNDNEPNVYSKGSILNIPFNTRMNINNYSDELLEFFVIKAPNPRDMVK